MREPYVKHFGIERYQSLYELRAKSKNMIRIIFTRMENGDTLFLTPFIKRRQRDTEPRRSCAPCGNTAPRQNGMRAAR